MAEKDEGFLVELFEMLENDQRMQSILDLNFLDSLGNDFPGMPEVPDPNQLSIPGVGLEPKGDFSERVIRNLIDEDFIKQGRDIESRHIGSDIALSSILEQLDLPAKIFKGKHGNKVYKYHDLLNFFKNEQRFRTMDLDIGNLRQELESEFGKDI